MRRTLLILCLLPFASLNAAEPTKLDLNRIITLDEFRTDGFGPARWLADGSGYTTLEPAEGGKGRDIVRHEPGSGRREVMVAASKLVPPGADGPIGIADYQWSGDGGSVLIFTNTRKVWRYHTRGDYWVFDRASGKLTEVDPGAPKASTMFAKFSRDGKRVGFVRESNIYVQDLATGEVTPLTTDGSPTKINGTFDWVYEEELNLRDGFRWSPDGKSIAYWQLDTTGMSDYVLVNTTDSLYPRLTTIRYPKVGQTNPSARIGVVSVRGGPTSWVPKFNDLRDNYIARMDWADNSTDLVIQVLTRLQDTAQVILVNVAMGNVWANYTEHDDTWVDVVDDLHWLEAGKRFTWISERTGWRRLEVVKLNGQEGRPITPMGYDVIDVLRVDSEAGEVDFIASPDDPKSRYLFRGQLDGSTQPKRLTPTDLVGTNAYQISPDGKWAFLTHSSMGSPPVIELVSLPDHRTVRTLVDNAKARARLDGLAACPAEFFRVEVEKGVELDGWCLKPPGFDPAKSYPLLIHVYGEPAGQTVLDRWDGRRYLWHRMLAEHGFIVASVDNRGTPAPRGRDWRKSIYRQIGILASKDQAEAVRNLEKRWPFVDRARVGVWGWSGGGSMTLNAMFRYPDVYNTGVAVAFISDQTLYDTIYQERYMGLPSGNPDGYRDGSPITHAGGLKGNLMLIHGTGDDNCHYQSCERLVDRLIALDKPFSMMAYPNRSHSIDEGANTSRHLYETMTRFLESNLRP